MLLEIRTCVADGSEQLQPVCHFRIDLPAAERGEEKERRSVGRPEIASGEEKWKFNNP